MNAKLIIAILILGVSMVSIGATVLVMDFTNPRDQPPPPFLITDPQAIYIPGLVFRFEKEFQTHNGYSIADALNETASVSFDMTVFPIRVIQIALEIFPRKSGVSKSRMFSHFPGCLDGGYQDLGYCYTNLNVTKGVLYFTVAWWRQKFALRIFSA